MSQVILITGCSSGIGRAIAEECVRLGHRTFATARDLNSISDLNAETLQLDVTDEDSIKHAVTEVIKKAGGIDVLINNAGFNQIGPLAETPTSLLRKLLDTNTVGLLAVTQAVIPHMAEQQRGCIVNMGSIVGVAPTPFTGGYCATKSAVHIMSEILRMEVAPLGIKVVLVQPGAVRSRIAEKAANDIQRYDESTSMYKSVFEGIKKRAGLSQVNPCEAEEFAANLVMAVTRANPPRIFRGGNGVKILRVLRLLPSKVYDNLMSRQFGLHKFSRNKIEIE